jgi:HPt (histidine-containing phosphotransfer) domain-containing protein
MAEKIPVIIDNDLKDLIPKFLSNREKDMEEMMSAYEGDDFDTICSVSHKIAGNAGGYGFDAMGDIAREMEHESKDGKDKEKIKGYLDGIRNYLDNVEITYE